MPTFNIELTASEPPDVFLHARCASTSPPGNCPNPPIVAINARYYCPAHLDDGFSLALEPVRSALARSEFDYLIDEAP